MRKIEIELDDNTFKAFEMLVSDEDTTIQEAGKVAIQKLILEYYPEIDALTADMEAIKAEIADRELHPDKYKSYTDVEELIKDLQAE